MKTTRLVLIITAVVALSAGAVYADRLILTPTGTTLGTADIKAEYATSSEGDNPKVFWLNIGISRFEVEGARFQDFGPEDVDLVSAQVSVIPETTFTPAVSIGMRDLADEADGGGVLYGGRAIYVAASKSIPITGGVPVLFQDMKVHGGVGTESLSGLFFGVEGRLPMGIKLAAEYDTEDVNWALSYGIAPAVSLKLSSLKQDIYYGAALSTAF
jgi:hypothetical protein